jgi:hypothetical protein
MHDHCGLSSKACGDLCCSRDHVDGDAHAFVLFHGSAEAEAFLTGGHQLSVASGQGTVDEDFGSDEIGSLGANFAWEIDSIATDSPADLTGFFIFGRQAETARR